MKHGILVGVATLTALAGAASAAIQSDSFSFGPSAVPFSGSDVLDLFDTAGGTRVLDTMKITYSLTLQADVSVTANSGPQNVQVGVVGNSLATDGIFSLPVSISGTSTSPTLMTGQTHNFGTLSFSDTQVYNVVAGLFPTYTGFPGTFTVNFNGNGLFGIQGGGDATIDVSNFGGSGTISVEYNYHTVPTPGAVALMGLGGLAAARRRRA